MKLCSIASGSSGNCIFAGSETTSLLIDAGISGKRVEAGLAVLDRSAKELDGILVTHEHSDHIQGLGVLARRYGIPIYATDGTIQAMQQTKSLGKFPEGIFHTIHADDAILSRPDGRADRICVPERLPQIFSGGLPLFHAIYYK